MAEKATKVLKQAKMVSIILQECLGIMQVACRCLDISLGIPALCLLAPPQLELWVAIDVPAIRIGTHYAVPHPARNCELLLAWPEVVSFSIFSTSRLKLLLNMEVLGSQMKQYSWRARTALFLLSSVGPQSPRSLSMLNPPRLALPMPLCVR